MTVEEKKGYLSGEDGDIDKFPIGMRVLAVDDDPTCLKVLENFLRACQYEVTVTIHAVTALKMLRENRNKYDLVISDVNMPDMDGFKLLELVGLEMDLPVIMLSAHSDTNLVMKGIAHGACDYLLKPVRIEELKNIWQHVIRRKKVDPKDRNKSPNQENARAGAGEGAMPNGNSDQNGNFNRKRKDQDEYEDEEGDDDDHENEESTTQKKPRVVWSMELHRKFVGAVNQLGLDKAVPKKILDLMNVEGLTRENVASHLQKYRLYLRKLSTVGPEAGMVAALGSKDSSYLRMCALDGFGNLHSLNSPGRLSSSALSSYIQGSMLGRLNSTAGSSTHGIASSGMIQPGHSQSLNTSFNTIGKIQQAMFPANRNSNLYQGLQTSLELNQLPQSKSTTDIGDFNHINSPTAFTAATGFTDARAALGSSSSSVSTSSSNHLMLQANPHQAQSFQAYGNQSSLSVASLNQDSFDVGFCGSSNYLDHSRCNESWQGAVQLSQYPSNSLPLSKPFSHDQVPPNNLSNILSSTSCLDFSSSMTTSTPLENSRGDLFCKAGLIGNEIQNYTSKQQWEEHKQDFNQYLNNPFSTVNSLVSGNCTMGPFSRSMDQTNASYVAQHANVEKPPLDTKLRSNEDYLLEQSKSHDGFVQNNYDPLDDMMSAMIKQDPSETISMDGELAFDPYSLGSCM